MKAFEMYKRAKACGCIYSDKVIKSKIASMGSIKRWSVYDGGEDCKAKFYNRVEHIYMDENFNLLRYRDGDFYIFDAFQFQFQEPVTGQLFNTVVEAMENLPESAFTDEEMTRITATANRYNMRSVLSYGSGDSIYSSIGVLKESEDDNSPTVGFEIETQLADGFYRPAQPLISELLDVRLGHLERDSSIAGVEFDSHTFTWEKLKKCKGYFRDQFQKFSEMGLVPNAGAGLHIHIGRNAFTNEGSFEKFFYLVNTIALRSVWESLARRTSGENSYSRFTDSRNVIELRNNIVNFRREHNVAVNQQHSATYEIRIFQTTFSTNVLYGTIEMLLNLISFCNRDDVTTFNISDILDGDYVPKLLRILPAFSSECNRVNPIDMQMFLRLTRNAVIEKMQECLSRGDIEGAGEWARRLEQQNRRDGSR